MGDRQGLCRDPTKPKAQTLCGTEGQSKATVEQEVNGDSQNGEGWKLL